MGCVTLHYSSSVVGYRRRDVLFFFCIIYCYYYCLSSSFSSPRRIIHHTIHHITLISHHVVPSYFFFFSAFLYQVLLGLIDCKEGRSRAEQTTAVFLLFTFLFCCHGIVHIGQRFTTRGKPSFPHHRKLSC